MIVDLNNRVVGEMPIKHNVYQLVTFWLDSKPVGHKFGPRDIQGYIYGVTEGKRYPQDGTITRYIRMYNQEQGGHIKNISRAKSQYQKIGERTGAENKQGVLINDIDTN